MSIVDQAKITLDNFHLVEQGIGGLKQLIREVVEHLELEHCAKSRLESELQRLQKWASDLQSGMYINCVYCGHRYGPRENTPISMADVLKEHIEKCPAHPMSALKADVANLEKILSEQLIEIENLETKLQFTRMGQRRVILATLWHVILEIAPTIPSDQRINAWVNEVETYLADQVRGREDA